MHALHQTLLPPSAVHHSLYVPHLTPSTIYPFPSPPSNPVKVIGNLVVAGGQDLRVFEIREQVELDESATLPDGDVSMDENEPRDPALDDGFFDSEPPHREPLAAKTTHRLHLLANHQLHGHITGLHVLRTLESANDGLDRILVGFKDAKMAILEWSQGDIATVSLHTYERCPQVMNGDLSSYTPILRADPLSRVALLTLPEDTLAVLPLLQEVSDFADDPASFGRDVPYSPSFVLPMSDVTPTLRNLTDIHFLPGFHSPTVAFLYAPVQTWAGRLHTARDTFVVEIRTFDLSSTNSYPLLTKAEGLPSDSQYMVPAPKGLGGVVVVTTSGIIHVDQTGNRVATSVNGWFSHTSRNPHRRHCEHLCLTLEGSKAIFISEKDMLLTLVTGRVHHVRFVIDGRTVSKVTVEPEAQGMRVPCASSFASSGIANTTSEDGEMLFVGCAEGDSSLLRTRLIPREEEGVISTAPADLMEVDDEDDLYGDALVPSSGPASAPGKKPINPNAICDLDLTVDDVLEGVGRIADMVFGQARNASGDRTNPQLVLVGGGDGGGVFNVLRRGVPITKRRVINELNSATNTWFLPIMRTAGQKLFRDVPDSERSTILISTDGETSQVYALTTTATPDSLTKIEAPALATGIFFQRSCFAIVTPRALSLYDGDAQLLQELPNESEHDFVSASISDPYIAIRRVDGSVAFFAGDSMARTLAVKDIGIDTCIATDVFRDVTGIYRTFEAQQQVNGSQPINRNGVKERGQLSEEQMRRLQEHKPAITSEKPSMELALDAGRGSQWFAVLLSTGDLEIRSLPDLDVVLRTDGLATSAATFTDDGDASKATGEVSDVVTHMIFLPVGKRNPRPHLMVIHKSGRLNVYEAQPRFTLDTSTQTRRSLAVRFRKSLTQVLSTRQAIAIHPFANLENHTGAFITGQGPCWILSSDAHPVRSYALKQAAMAFGRTTHLGNMGDYFIRIEDGTFICYFPPKLNTEFSMPCDRYRMQRPYTSITYDPSSSHYVAAATMTAKFQLYDEEAEIQLGPQGETLIPPVNERSTLELLSQGSEPFRVLDGFEFKQNEIVLCLESVNLESQSTVLGRKDFIAVGTGFNYGEDRASRGGVYIFEIVETVPDPADPGSGFKLKLRARDDCRNPVSAIADINGYLIHSNGPKVFVKGLDYDERLMGLAFLDVMLYVTSIKVFKNLILISDLVKSVWFVGFQEEPYKLVTISKDVHPVSLNLSDFLIHDGQVAFISSDQQGIMRLLEYDATDPETNAGERLLLRNEYQAGALHMASLTIARRKTEEEKYAPQTQIVYATAEGSLTTLVAVKPARYKRLQLVQDQMVRSAEHVAGLNPRAYRTVRNDLEAKPLSKGILDGQLLQEFALQPTTAQREMMRQIGTDAMTVASDLQALGGFW